MKTLSQTLDQDALISAPEAAKILTIATQTLSRWRYQGHPHIPYIKIGGIVRYRTNDIKDYIDKHTHQTAELNYKGVARKAVKDAAKAAATGDV